MLDYQQYDALFLANPDNDATNYGVTVEQVGGAEYRCIGVHHLTPEENKGGAFVFLSVLDESGQRIPGAKVGWTWEGKPLPALNVWLDKGENEPPGHIGLSAGMVVSVWKGDIVNGLRCDHQADEEPQSFYVVFQRVATTPQPPGPVPPQPPIPGDLEARVDALEARVDVLTAAVDWIEQTWRKIGEALRGL